ncbi:MAG: alpha-amylase family glycosyl hydrolase [Terracidiphilus sp.]
MNRMRFGQLAGLCVLGLAAVGGSAAPSQAPQQASRQTHSSRTALPWYVTTGAIHRVSLKKNSKYHRFEYLSLDATEAASQLRAWKDAGIDAIEVFAPEEGGNSYGGLDAKDRYALDPGTGSIEDFRRLVRQAHALHMSIVTFQNLGYAAVDAPQFLKAEDDVRAGRNTRERRFFYWSERADAPPPATGDSYFLIRPSAPGYDPSKTEFWQWSERAQHYYWTRWPGKGPNGETTHLPQYDWASAAWPEEASRVVDFWMNTGLDGMVVDAVNWYVGYDWKKNAVLISAIRRHPGAKLTVPEGGGAFHTDDPTGWVRDGEWTALYDYGLDIWWERQSRPMFDSIEKGDPGLFEQALRSSHDRVVAAGGILIQPVLDMKDPGKQQLEEGLLATSGDMLCYCNSDDATVRPAPGIPSLLKLKAQHPALFQNSVRRRIATNQDASVYATLRHSADGSERILVVFNFSSQPISAEVDARAIFGSRYRNLESGEMAVVSHGALRVELDGYGHRIFRVDP